MSISEFNDFSMSNWSKIQWFFHDFFIFANFKNFSWNSMIFPWSWNRSEFQWFIKSCGNPVHQALCIISNPLVNSNWSDSSETPISAQNQRYLSLVTLKFQGWPWKTIGHLFYVSSRFGHHFIAICEFELELQFEKSQFWVKIDIF